MSGLRLGVLQVGLLAFAVGSACKAKTAAITEPFADPFDRAEIGPTWLDTGGGYAIDEGQVRAKGAYNHPLWLRKRLPKDVVIELDATAMTAAGDIKVELFGDGESFDPDKGGYMATGYVLVLGGWRNSLSVIAKINEHDEGRKAQRADVAVQQGRKYHFTITRKNGTIDWKIDGQPHLSWTDPSPLQGAGNEFFGFNNWEVEVKFDNLTIKPAP